MGRGGDGTAGDGLSLGRWWGRVVRAMGRKWGFGAQLPGILVKASRYPEGLSVKGIS